MLKIKTFIVKTKRCLYYGHQVYNSEFWKKMQIEKSKKQYKRLSTGKITKNVLKIKTFFCEYKALNNVFKRFRINLNKRNLTESTPSKPILVLSWPIQIPSLLITISLIKHPILYYLLGCYYGNKQDNQSCDAKRRAV